MRLQACLNGSHRPEAGRPVPVAPTELADAARDAVRAGAQGVHLHPKRPDGTDDLSPEVVGTAVEAVTAAVPGIPIGVTTGAWAAPGTAERHELVEGWARLHRRPDVASVNWHEHASPALAAVLLDGGIGVEAGIWTPDTARAFARWPRQGEVTRILVEATEHDPDRAIDQVSSILAALAHEGVDGRLPELLVHGEEDGAWPVLRWATAHGYAVRIGLEDSATRADGAPARSSAEQVADAVRLLTGLPTSQ